MTPTETTGERAAEMYPPIEMKPGDELAWLIERGQPEKQVPTVWWADRERWGLAYKDSWTTDAFKAFRFESKEDAERVIERQFTPPVSRGGPSARAVEHGFVAAVPSESDAGLDALAAFARWLAPHLTVERSHAIAAEFLDAKVRRRG